MNSPGMEQNPSSLCQVGQGQPSLEVAGEAVLLDHVLTPQDKTLLSGWVWKPGALMVTHGSRSSLPSLIQSWHSPPEQTTQQLVGWAGPCPSPPAALTPHRAGALCPTTTIPTKAPDPAGLSFQGEKNPVTATPTLP